LQLSRYDRLGDDHVPPDMAGACMLDLRERMRVMLERREAEVEDAGWDDKECRRRTKVWRMARPEATEWYLEGSVTGT
jgi:hypothetical protein